MIGTNGTPTPYTIVTVGDQYAVRHPDGRQGQPCQYLEADAQRRFLNRGWAAAMAAAREEMDRQLECEARERGLSCHLQSQANERINSLRTSLESLEHQARVFIMAIEQEHGSQPKWGRGPIGKLRAACDVARLILAGASNTGIEGQKHTYDNEPPAGAYQSDPTP